MKNFVEIVGEKSYSIISRIKDSTTFIGEVFMTCGKALIKPHKIRWKETLEYINSTGYDAIPIVMLVCILMGVTLGIQAAIMLTQWGTEIFMADMIAIIMFKELGPIMVAIIAAGRSGSAFAAEIATMKVNEEVDAMTTMGLDLGRFLIVPKMVAMLFAAPFLVVFANFAGVLGGFLVGVFQLGIPAITYWNRTIESLTLWDFGQSLIKGFVFVMIITTISCMKGFASGSDAKSVGNAAISAVVANIFAVIIADALLTIIFNLG
jgi:phospholipid/cholesterol/gamma-HCH transport system permease protein